MIYIKLALAAVILSVICKGFPLVRETIRNEEGEYTIHFKKKKDD